MLSKKEYRESSFVVVLVWLVANVVTYFIVRKEEGAWVLFLYENLLLFLIIGTRSYCFILLGEQLVVRNQLWFWYEREFMLIEIDKLEMGVGQGAIADTLRVVLLSGKTKVFPTGIGKEKLEDLIITLKKLKDDKNRIKK